MNIEKNDLHVIFNRKSELIKVYDFTGNIIFSAPCRNRAVNLGFFYHGQCPPTGENEYYLLGKPIWQHKVEFGDWFIPLIDIFGIWKRYKRSEIGIHGGGTGLKWPFALYQQWKVTLGCFRMQNKDLKSLVGLINGCFNIEGKCYFTVTA